MSNLERTARRSGWRRGRSIVTPDGTQFWLPVLGPEHVGKLPRLGRYLRDSRDGQSFLSVTGDRPEDFEEIVGFMAGIVGEALALNYDLNPADLAGLMEVDPPKLRSGRLVAAVREVMSAAKDAGLVKHLLFEPMEVCR